MNANRLQITSLLKFMDKGIGTLAIYCIARPVPAGKPETFHSILFIRPGGIGDAALLVPAILAFRKIYAGARIAVLAEKRNGAVFRLCPAVDELLLYDRPGDLRKAVRGSYDAVIDTEQWHRLSAVVARITRAPMLIGFGTNEKKRLFTHPVPYSHDAYEADSFSHLLHIFGIATPPETTPPFLTLPPNAAKRGEGLLGKFIAQPFVAIFPGASIPERRWGAYKFRMLVERLYERGIPVVVVGGKEDAFDGDRIVAGEYGLNLAGKTSLVETAAVIEKSRLLLSGDSGILHIGVGHGKPTVSLFGPGIAKKWAPRGEKHIVINKNLPCSPCTKFGYTPKCPINAKCMADITVDEVVAAVEKLLQKQGITVEAQHI